MSFRRILFEILDDLADVFTNVSDVSPRDNSLVSLIGFRASLSDPELSKEWNSCRSIFYFTDLIGAAPGRTHSPRSSHKDTLEKFENSNESGCHAGRRVAKRHQNSLRASQDSEQSPVRWKALSSTSLRVLLSMGSSRVILWEWSFPTSNLRKQANTSVYTHKRCFEILILTRMNCQEQRCCSRGEREGELSSRRGPS